MSTSPLIRWARASGIAALGADDLDRSADFRSNYCIDFGKYLVQVPDVVLQPRSRSELVSCLSHLWHERIPWKARGTGHSAGGQVLSHGGVIIDVRGLDRVLQVDRDRADVTVEGGATWLSLVQQLAPYGLRPPVLTDNLRMTIAGTLSVGGMGDTSHIQGLQAGHVTAITLVHPDGSVQELSADNDRFGYVLCGRGQLGILAAARIPLLSRPSTMSARVLRWYSLAQFLHDAEQIRQQRLYEFFRSTLHWPQGEQPFYVEAIAGNFCSESAWNARAIASPPEDPADAWLHADQRSPLFFGDRLAHAQHDPIATWNFLCPNVELVFPLPAGLPALQDVCEQVARSTLCPALSEGSALMLLPANPDLPLAPLPPASTCVALALRPRLHSADQVFAQLPFLRRLAAQALRSGARLYLASIDVTEPGHFDRDEFLHLQFGDSLPALRQYKTTCDPHHLANRGVLIDA